MRPLLALVVVPTLAAVGVAAEPPARPPVEFTRLFAHWDGYASPDYLAFVAEARPQVCQVGFYGGHFYSLAHTPQYNGYPAHFPVRGLAECGRWFEDRNAALHKLGVKVVGHFNVTFLIGEPEGPDGPRGFFRFYRDLWDEQELGPKPIADPLALLARTADGRPMASRDYGVGGMREFTACLNNPHWRAVLKAWARQGIKRGVDGYIVNYFYRHNCLCEYCRAGFRDYLASRFTPQQLRDRFGIADLKTHVFPEIVGWHDPRESTPLRREMLRWSQLSTKAAFDEVFVTYARGLKPDLILAQWNHLGDFAMIRSDERCLLPPDLWAKDEDYLWYSLGDTANFTDLANGFLGEGTLQARYLRGASGGKPFVLGKYETTRVRVAIAELAANGGAPMGFYARFQDPEARRELVRYYRFLERYDTLYRGSRSHAEVLLLFPRSRVHEGDVAAIELFRQRGRELLEAPVLFDVLPDDRLRPEDAARYRLVIDPVRPPDRLPPGLSRFTAPRTVRVSAGVSADGTAWAVHFVNYNRTEPPRPKDRGRGIADEKPVAVESVEVDLAWPAARPVTAVYILIPEEPDPIPVRFHRADGRLRFTVPRFLVYAVARIDTAR